MSESTNRLRAPAPRSDAPAINGDALVASVVAGQVANSVVRATPYRIGRDGVLRVLPGTAGVTLNRRVGDRAVGLAGDHVEPGLALRNNDRDLAGGPGGANRGLLTYSCIGNQARVVSGPATGAVGTVTGKHGGINNLLVDFTPAVLRRIRIGDRVQVTACGQGMELRAFPQVRVMNLAPRLLARWGVRVHGDHLDVPVTHMVPGAVLGSGFGRSDAVLGDVDIQLADPAVVRAFALNTLRFGDLVAVCPLDARHGPSPQANRITIGVVVHSDSMVAGHGPGVTPLLVGESSTLRPIYDPGANLALRLGLRERIPAIAPPRTSSGWFAGTRCSLRMTPRSLARTGRAPW